jgi:surfactin synthase thioesterase subunit
VKDRAVTESGTGLDAELVQRLAALAGLPLSLDRAADLVPGLLPIFEGDAEIVALNLGTLSPLGTPWPQRPREEPRE